MKKLISAISNGAIEDVKERAKAISGMEAEQITNRAYTYEELTKDYLGRTIPMGDGLMVSFNVSSIDKLNVPLLYENGVNANLEDLMKKALFAYSQRDNYTSLGHKTRNNALEYRNYIVKLNDKGTDKYCKFTILRYTDGIEVSHGAMVVDVEVTEKPLQSLPTILREPQALEVVKEVSSAKIVYFFSIAKFEKKLSDAPQYEFFVEDNGQAKEITETIFTEDKYRERDSSSISDNFTANDVARNVESGLNALRRLANGEERVENAMRRDELAELGGTAEKTFF